MNVRTTIEPQLIGIGLYTPAEAARLIDVPAARIIRWLRGHQTDQQTYARLWRPQIRLDDDKIYLGFLDLMQARVADRLIAKTGLSAIKVRRAIALAANIVGHDHPLSTQWLSTDGRAVFLDVVSEDGSRQLIDLFKSQFAFRESVAPSLRGVDFDDNGLAESWWPLGRKGQIVLDPKRAFGQPIDAESAVPVAALAAAATAEGSAERAARAWNVSEAAVSRAVRYQAVIDRKAA